MGNKGTYAIGIIIVVLILFAGYFVFVGESVNVYMDGENVTSQAIISPFSGVNTNELNKEISDYTFQTMNNTSGDTKSLKQGILKICLNHGLDNVKVKVDSSIGENEIPILFHVQGT